MQGGEAPSGGHIRDNGGSGAGAADNHHKHGAVFASSGLSGRQIGLLCLRRRRFSGHPLFPLRSSEVREDLGSILQKVQGSSESSV